MMKRDSALRDILVVVVLASLAAFLFLRQGPRDNAFEDALPERVVAEPDPYVDAQMIVGLTDGAAVGRLRSQLEITASTSLPLPGIQVWSLPDTLTVAEAVRVAQTLPGIRFAEPNFLFS